MSGHTSWKARDKSTQSRNDIHVFLGSVVSALVADYRFWDAINFSINISTSDVSKNPKFCFFDSQSSKSSDFTQGESFINFTSLFEVKKIESFNQFTFKNFQKDIFFY